MVQEHSHAGDPTYIAYTHDRCRHPDCLKAFEEYKLRLAARKLSGEFQDLRRRENRIRTAQQRLAEQPKPSAAEPPELPPDDGASVVGDDPPASTAQPEFAPDEIPADDKGVILSRLRKFCMPSGQVYGPLADVNVLAAATGIDPDRVAAIVRELLRDGQLVKRGGDVFLEADV